MRRSPPGLTRWQTSSSTVTTVTCELESCSSSSVGSDKTRLRQASTQRSERSTQPGVERTVRRNWDIRGVRLRLLLGASEAMEKLKLGTMKPVRGR